MRNGRPAIGDRSGSCRRRHAVPGLLDDRFGSDDGAVYALDASSGEQRWRFPAGGWRPRATEDPVASERPSIKAECYA
ncbi:hypothetical protein [Nonomuraea sp. NPDC049141]|uniref:hypothetical protein n=1 Tax=Nonomuraea sp. NPDC049141 TaxID=3155500 RepID=UPI0033C09BFE